MARDWRLGKSTFLDYYGVNSEIEYKSQCMASGRIMQHAHMGFRDRRKSLRACTQIFESAEKMGTRVDRFGLCLDWSMGFPRSVRGQQMQGTGIILNGPEEFVEIANAAPIAPHFGDFVLGFPAALENTQAALAAGATVIGNLGQYFTFRLPNWIDDIATTRSTLKAIGLMSAQDAPVMVHSNLDDGFAAVFEDLSCALGAAMIERRIVEDLVGAKITHCFGHHYSTPLLRLGFQKALAKVSPNPGSMIFGNTVSYRGNDAQNYASLGGYLMLDILGQQTCASGHAINPVPVTENRRIPEIEEIINAQVFAGKMVEASAGYQQVYDQDQVAQLSDNLVRQGEQFYDSVIKGLTQSGIDVNDPFQMLLSIRRIGGKTLEKLFGPGSWNSQSERRSPIVMSDTIREINHQVGFHLESVSREDREILGPNRVKVLMASTDVHEHSKMLLESVFREIDIEAVDGGVSADSADLVRLAEQQEVDAIALSTYNGVALTYYCQLRDELKEAGMDIPVMIGGQLNEIPDDSETSLPVNVESRLSEEGAQVCLGVLDAILVLLAIAREKPSGVPIRAGVIH